MRDTGRLSQLPESLQNYGTYGESATGRATRSDSPDLTRCDPGEPMSIREVAQLIGCSVWTVRQRHLPSGLPHFRACAAGKLTFYRNQVVCWLVQQQNLRKGG